MKFRPKSNQWQLKSTIHLGLEIQLEPERFELMSALRKKKKREKTYGHGTSEKLAVVG